MKTLSNEELHRIIGPYAAPAGLYQYTKSLPFLGTVTSDVTSLTAGQWTEITIGKNPDDDPILLSVFLTPIYVVYTVGGSGLADGAWIKGTFKFYSVSI